MTNTGRISDTKWAFDTAPKSMRGFEHNELW